ncbi:MAG: hypothetical protein M3O87_04640 [Candidatus Dormibacteraeota bacterium]|nr:hypothetical protein [Candidatus Dormibacteraeota bacterium]
MSLDLGRVLGRTFSLTWRHKWLWLLGVFGGGGGIGFRDNFSVPTSSRNGPLPFTQDQLNVFLHDWGWLIIAVVVALVLIALVGFVVTCIAVPASTWAALALDAGEPATLGLAWRQGLRRFWVYFRLYLLRLLISLAVVTVAGLLVILGVLIFAGAGPASLWILIPLGIVLVLALIVASLVLAFLFAWSERTPIVLGVGAVDALRTSAHLARRAWADTLLFAVIMGVIATLIGLGVVVVAAVVAIPGVFISLAGLGANSSVIIGAGVLWVVLLGGAVFLVGGGYVGSLVQVSYAMACRDLCLSRGMELSPDIPLPAAAPPAGLPAAPPAPA